MPALLPLPAFLAGLLGLAGVGVLYVAWRRPGRSTLLRTVGWGLLAVSAVPWAMAGGADRGVALGTVLVMTGALLLIGLTGQWRGGEPRRQRVAAAAAEPLSETGWRHWAAVFLAAGPLAAVVAYVMAMPLMHVTAWAEANRLMAMASIGVILWSVGAVWACATRSLARTSAAMAALGAAGAALLLVL